MFRQIEPVTPTAPRPVRRCMTTQWWRDLTFLHWPVAPEAVRGLLPRGTRPDVLDGQTYVGLVGLRMDRVGLPTGPGVPYFGSFSETNVRLYSVDCHGRRGVVFCSMDASRLLPVLVGRIGLQLPYVWSRMRVGRAGDVMTYTARRRWPGPRSISSRMSVRIGAAVREPNELEHFVTARWGMHSSWHGRTLHTRNAHPCWRLHHAELVELEDTLIAAAGLPQPIEDPVSVLWSPGVPVRFSWPREVRALAKG